MHSVTHQMAINSVTPSAFAASGFIPSGGVINIEIISIKIPAQNPIIFDLFICRIHVFLYLNIFERSFEKILELFCL